MTWPTGGSAIPYLLRLRSSVARLSPSLRRYDVISSQWHGLSRTYEHICLYVLAKAVQGGDRSNIRLSHGRILDRSWLGAFDQWQNLTGHIIYMIFDGCRSNILCLFYWCRVCLRTWRASERSFTGPSLWQKSCSFWSRSELLHNRFWITCCSHSTENADECRLVTAGV